ncbi:MAG: DUF3718 domain-containing protein [Colwellia sp.]|nr:DUF3718 domain-containing protein [Colwellia sp.]
MNTFKKTTLALAATLPLFFASMSSQASMDPGLEKELISICKAAASNNVMKLKDKLASAQLSEYNVTLNLSCNNTDLISFAEQHNANKVANKLRNRIGQVSITDVASLSTMNVSFIE